MKKKILALVMSCALFATMLPSTVLADVEENAEAEQAAEEEGVQTLAEDAAEDADAQADVEATEVAEEDGVQTLADDEADESEPAVTAWTGNASGKVVINLGNGNGKYNFADYAGNKDAGTDLRYTTDSLADYADDDGNLTINLPSDNDLDSTFTVVDESGGLSAVTVALGNCKAYDYKLVGWVNIATGKYYDVSNGATTADIDLDNENVFYADWIAATYDHGSETDANLRDDIVSTKGFVTMHMYDFNELYNLYSESLVQNGTDYEEWTDSSNLYNQLPYPSGNRVTSSFIFVNDGTTDQVLEDTGGMLSWPADKTAGNSWTGSGEPPRDATAIWGITSPYSAPMNMLYGYSSTPVGVHYLGEADYLFWLDDNGYYTYNSKEAAATYNQSDECFYVYDGTQRVEGTEFSCFLPYNTYGEELSAFDGSVDYWFGMDMEVNFYLPSDTGTNGNQSNGKDMVFNFSGDDDILIFVDDALLLDMSGIHDESFGSINFADGTVTMGMEKDDEGVIHDGTTTDFSLKAGAHDLKVYYMERGGYASNLEIQFNVASLWEYESGNVQTVTAEKTWEDAQGNVIDPEDLPDEYKENGVEVGLFDVLGPASEGTYGYTQSGNTYTVEYTDDKGVTQTYVYDASGPTLEYTEVSSEGTISETYDKTDSEGRVVDDDGYVIAWLDGENLYIRIDEQTLNDANNWYYAWELLDADASYEVLELSESSSYTTTSEKENLLRYNYWSIIGDSQIEDSFEAGETLPVILTEAAQEASNKLGNTKDAMGWVIVASDSGITTQQIEFSQIAELLEEKDDSSGQTSYKTIAGVTSQSEVDKLGSGAIWYVVDAEKQTGDITGDEVEDFYLYCDLNDTEYYLVLDGTTLTVTSDASEASTFCYDSLGELLVVLDAGSTERVEIQPDGTITIGDAELEAALDDIRIFTLQETETSGFAFTATNRLEPAPDKNVDADGDEVYEDSGMQVRVGDTLVYKIDYQNPDDEAATVTITDEVDVGLDFVEATDDGTYDESTRTITWVIEDVEPNTDGSVYFTATVNETALVKSVVENKAKVQVGNHAEQETKTVYNPLTPDEKDVDADGDGSYGDTGQGVQVGDTLTYMITYFNDDEENPVTVTITDVLDEGLDFDAASDGGTYDESTRTITWDLGQIEAQTGGYVTFTAVVNENALVKNEVENTAEIIYGDNPAVETNPVYNPVPDKDVDADGDEEFEDSGMQVEVGGTLVYKIDYENPDDEAATVTITDEVDVGLDFVEATDGGTYDESTRTITWVIEDVDPHTNGSVYFTATVNENALVKNYVENTATVQVGEHDAQQTKTVYNPVPGKDVDADGDGEYGDNGKGVQVGDTMTYEISYFNGYESAATVTITDTLDDGLTYVSSDPDAAISEDSEGHTVLTWTIANVSAQTGGSVTFTAIVNENALITNVVDNDAEVQVNDDPAVTTEEMHNPVPDKDVDADGDGEYEDSGMQVEIGDTLVYKIDYENPDDDPVTVTITDEVDVGLDFVSATDNGSYDEGSRMITWVIEGVEAHTNGSVYFTATVNENALDKHYVENTAFVTVGNHAEQQTKTVYNPVPEKDVDADGDGTYGDNGKGVQVGDTMTYVIDYFNGYDQAATVTIKDVLDDGLTYVSSEPEAAISEEDGHMVLTWTFEGVEAQTGGSVTFTATVNDNALVKNEVENNATVDVGNDSTVTNTVYNPVPDKDVDADADGEYGDSGMQVEVGDTLTYKIDYQNPDDTAATVTITDVLDVGLDFVEASDGGTYDASTRTITWVLEDVAPHSEEGYYVTFEATVNEEALERKVVDNTAIVQVGDHPEQQTKTVWNPLNGKDVDSDGDGEYGDSGKWVNVGDVLTYEIAYYNEYDDPATVTITDVLDEGLTYVEDSATDGGTYDEDTRTITWVIEDVPAHTDGKVTFEAVVNEKALVENGVENSADVQIGDDPAVETNRVWNPLNGKDVDADGDGEYGDSGLEVQVGDTLTYEITYTNYEEDAATVTITDVLDIGLDFVSADNGGTYNESNRTITWVIEDVASEAGGTVTFTAIVNENALVKNEVDNTASIQIGDDPAFDTNTVYNPVPGKDVDVHGDGTFGDTGVGVQVGDTLTYEITYDNEYDDPATVTITDVLDEGLDFGYAADGGTYDEDTRTITWVIQNVPAHSSGSVSFTATVNETALVRNEVDNTATVQINDDPEKVTNTVYNPVPDKDVDADGDEVYEDSGMQVEVGSTLVYKIDYENPDDEATTVTITDEVDVGLDFVSATGEGSYDESTRTITWVIEGVEAHANGSVYFTATVNERALEKNYVENTATVQVGNHDAQQTKTVYNPVPDKKVDVNGDEDYDDSGVSVQVGDTLAYEITYYNGYETSATVTITDVLDEGLDFVEASDGGTYNERTRTITWVIEDVEGLTGGSVTFTAVVNEDALVKNEVDNTAQVQIGDNPDNVAYTPTPENPVPDKDVDADGDEVYEDSGMQVEVGSTLVYKIDYENPDDEATTVTITDEVDVGLDFVSATDEGSYNESTRTITWVIEGVEAHTNGSVYFTATVNERALEKNYVENTATVQVGNHDAQQTKTVYNPVPDKGVDVNGDEDYDDSGVSVQVGDTLKYEITYYNGYETPATVTITDELDEGLDFVEASDGGTYNERTRTITWVIEDVEGLTGGSVTFTAIVNEDALVKNEVDNTAQVQIGDNPDNVAYTPTPENPVPDKDVDADGDEVYEDSGMQVEVGSTLVYKIDYENPDDTEATVTITDEVDVGLDFVEATDGGTYDESTRTITWVIDGVEAHTNGSVYFTATVNENALVKNYVENTATVQIGEHDAQQTKTVYNPVPDKGVDVNGDEEYEDNGESVQVGDTLTYEISYFNGYDESATVTITDELDEGLDFVEASDGGTYNERTRTITWVIEDVEGLTDGSVTFTAIVNENALVINEVNNTATVEIGNSVNTNTVYNPVPDKDVDADGDGEFGDSGMQVQVGDTLVYKIEYQNTDDEPATVTITDELDVGLDFVYADNNGTYDESTRTITWVIHNVAPHSEEGNFVLFVATVNEEALVKNEVDNTATVQVGEHDAQQTKTVYNPVPEKGVDVNGDEKYDDTGVGVQVGDTLTYEITYFNGYETPATVTITDVLDEGLDYVEGSASDGGTYDESSRTVTWIIEDVAGLTEGSVTFDATVNETALVKNEVENTAIVQVGDDPSNVVETKPTDNPVPDKDVDANGDNVFEDSGMQVQVGDTLVYKIDYQNSDDEAATVTITDVLDEGLDFVSASDGGTYDKDTRTITWVLSDVAPHSEEGYYVTFTATVNETAQVKNYVENTAVVQVGEHDAQQTKTVYNPVPSKDVDADENHIFGDNGEEVYVGETMTYTINFFNGYDVEEEVIITDVLDDGLSYVEGSATEGGTYDADTHTLTWDIEHVEAHTAGSVTFSAVVNGSSLTKNEVDNTATVQIGTYSLIQTNTVENPVPDKDVDADGDGTYGDNGMPVSVGDDLTYRVDYHNSDDVSAEVIITDVLDVGLDFVSASDGGTYDASTRTITWTIEDVEAHTTGNVTFVATVNENALEKNEVENTASVKVGDWPAVDTNTVYNPVPQKDVDIHGDGSFGDSGLKVEVGDTLTYKVDYENPDDTAATVTITDVLDEGLDFVTASDGGTYDESSRTITWVLEDVSAHAQGSVTFDATANEKALVNGEVDNTATIQVGDHPEQQTNTVWNPLWEPEKSVDTDGNGDFEDDGVLVSVGDELVYKVTYKNYHDEEATVVITDALDENVTFISATDNGIYDAGSHTITWTLDNVAAGYEGDVQFTVEVKESAYTTHEVDNTATVKVGNDSQDTNIVHNPVPEKSVDVNGDEDFSDNGVKVEVGDELVYKIDYTNGHDEAATVTITDALDPNVEFVSATNDGSYDKDTHTVTWTIENVAAGTEDYVEFTVKVLASAQAENEVDNTASVKVGNDAAVDTNKIVNPLWEPEKSVDTNGDGIFEDDGVLVHVGDELVYQVTYKNYQDEAATITITDALDPNVEFVSATDGGAYNASTHTITWTLNNVAAGDEGTVQFTVTALASALAEGEVDNTASVKVGNDAAMDTNKVENPLWEPVKSVDTNGDGIFEDDGVLIHVGDELVYQITYKNYQDEAATITITDALDSNVEFVSATDDGVYDTSTHTVTWTLDNVAAGDEGTVQFTVTALQGAEEAGEVVNNASVKVGNDEALATNTVRNPVPNGTSGNTNPDSNPNPTSSNPNSGTGSGSNPNSGTGGSGTSGTGTPKTSDTNATLWYVFLICLAGAAVVTISVRRRIVRK